jgi:protein FAM50
VGEARSRHATFAVYYGAYVAEPVEHAEEILEVTYSYWDGSGHRREIKVSELPPSMASRVRHCLRFRPSPFPVVLLAPQLKKGTTIGKFLEQVKQQLSQEFSDIRAISPDDLMYIKEDLIIPHVRA